MRGCSRSPMRTSASRAASGRRRADLARTAGNYEIAENCRGHGERPRDTHRARSFTRRALSCSGSARQSFTRRRGGARRHGGLLRSTALRRRTAPLHPQHSILEGAAERKRPTREHRQRDERAGGARTGNGRAVGHATTVSLRIASRKRASDRRGSRSGSQPMIPPPTTY